MYITLNNETLQLPEDNMTVSDVLQWQNRPDGGTAVAINNRLVRNTLWDSTKLQDGDNMVIISAAFGG